MVFSICTALLAQLWHSFCVNRKWNVRRTTKSLLRTRLGLHALRTQHCVQGYYNTKQSSSGQRNCYSYLTAHVWKRPNGLEYCTFMTSVHLLSLFVSPAPPNNFLNQPTGFHEHGLKSNATKGWCKRDINLAQNRLSGSCKRRQWAFGFHGLHCLKSCRLFKNDCTMHFSWDRWVSLCTDTWLWDQFYEYYHASTFVYVSEVVAFLQVSGLHLIWISHL